MTFPMGIFHHPYPSSFSLPLLRFGADRLGYIINKGANPLKKTLGSYLFHVVHTGDSDVIL